MHNRQPPSCANQKPAKQNFPKLYYDVDLVKLIEGSFEDFAVVVSWCIHCEKDRESQLFGTDQMPQKQLALLVMDLTASSHFEEAAAVALGSVFSFAQEALAQSSFAASGRLLRGMVYIHPGDSYQRIFGLECASGARIEGISYFASANVWKWLVEHRCSVSIDVRLETIRPWLRDGPLRPGSQSGALPGQETRERLLSREATHVHVVPLCLPGGAVVGMLSLEANCKSATGQDFIWGECDEGVRLLASAAAPYLNSLPPLKTQITTTDPLLPVVGPSTASLIEMIRIFAKQEETLLISGPTGVGKSKLSRWCHEQSRRKGQPFEVLDLLSIPEELQMAELFGWKRGAFTGAIKDNAGAILRAQKGTLFIDEIDKLSLKAQAGLLHVIEERRYHPLGDEGGERRADVRFIIGTNADLRAAQRAGRFREDLYYRISVLPVRLPPLSERLDELPLWADYMLKRRSSEDDYRGIILFARDALQLLMDTPWPGNLRQLDNVIRRAYALSLHSQGSSGELVLQRQHIERALAYEVVSDTSSLLGQLWRAATAFVKEAERRSNGNALSLEMCDAFRGIVLGAAIQQLGSRERAFALFGQAQMLKHRNHHKALRRELDKVREVVRSLGGDIEPGLTALLQELDESASSL